MKHTTRRTRIGAAVLLVAAVGLAGCKAADVSADGPAPSDGTPSLGPTDGPTDEPSDGTGPTTGQAEVSLVVTVDATGEGATTTYTLTCVPTGGDHPDAEAACAEIAVAGDGADAFAPTPRDVTCTEQWGGPQTANVSGTADGERVDAEFDRHNGCEIARWDTFAALFGPDAGLL